METPVSPSSFATRISDVANESTKFLTPIIGLENEPLLTLNDTVIPLLSLIPSLDTFVSLSLQWSKSQVNLPHHLSIDEAAAVNLYTREWPVREDSLYYKLNSSLRTEDRGAMKPYFSYLRLMLHALEKIPLYTSSPTVWSGAQSSDLVSLYSKGGKVVWWGFSSCTSDMSVLSSSPRAGDNQEIRIVFNIHLKNAFSIQELSAQNKENEVLMPPARLFEVINFCWLGQDSVIIEMKEIQPENPLISFKNTEMSSSTNIPLTPTSHDQTTVIHPSPSVSSKTILHKTEMNSELENVPLFSNVHDISAWSEWFPNKNTTELLNLQDEFNNNIIHITLTGGGGVGAKTGLLYCLSYGKLFSMYDPTIEDYYKSVMKCGKECYFVEWLDTAGQEEYSAMRDQQMRWGDGFVLGYSITSRSSYEEACNSFREQILRTKETDWCPMVLVGAKMDLESMRQVTRAEAESWAQSVGIPFFEVSNVTGANVVEACWTIVSLTAKHKGGKKEVTKSNKCVIS